MDHIWEKPEEIPKMKIVYKDEQLKLIKKKEIKMLNKEKKKILKIYKKKLRETNTNKKKFKKRDLKNLSIGRALQIINAPKRVEEEKDEKIIKKH